MTIVRVSLVLVSLPELWLCIGFSAIDQIFRVIDEQSQPSFDENFNFISYYNWTGGNGALSPSVPNAGNGEPKAYTGMVGTHHRPSDDLSVFAFLTPANAMLSVELGHLADILDATGQASNVSQSAKEWSTRIHDSIWNHTLVDNIFAYETNGRRRARLDEHAFKMLTIIRIWRPICHGRRECSRGYSYSIGRVESDAMSLFSLCFHFRIWASWRRTTRLMWRRVRCYYLPGILITPPVMGSVVRGE